MESPEKFQKQLIRRSLAAGRIGLKLAGTELSGCVASTIAFTHGRLVNHWDFSKSKNHNHLEKIAREAARISKERLKLTEFDTSNPLTSEEFGNLLSVGNKFWIDIIDGEKGAHAVGILADRNRYHLWDPASYSSPLTPNSFRRIFSKLERNVTPDGFYFGAIFAFDKEV